MGRTMFLMLEGPQDGELRLTIPIHQFILLCSTEEWHNLSLWKFAKAYELFSKLHKQHLQILSIYIPSINQRMKAFILGMMSEQIS